ncbi:hypothetical protein [Streptomyces sp. S063]|uniref:hypothetical protein n=1 Tax=Streptomyces sp. S063 TaxID=2005885 RepID=UPI001F244F0F|nr:hypothetical protein [Streptomyces sp. S063]
MRAAAPGAPASAATTGHDVAPRRRARTAGQFTDRAADLRGELLPGPRGHEPADESDDDQDEAEVLQRGLPAVAAKLHHPGEAEQPLLGALLHAAAEPPAATRSAQQDDGGHRYGQPREAQALGPAAELGKGTEDDPGQHGEEPVPDANPAVTDAQRQHEDGDPG